MKFIATCKLGLEAVVAHELRSLSICVQSVQDARVCFEGDFLAMARACLWLRAAERVLLVVGEFRAATFEELFQGVRALDWKSYLAPDSNIHVNGKSAKSTLFSVSDCQSITKKAIVESLRAAYRTQVLPESGAEVIVEVGLLKDDVTLALDCCGAGLSRRGYRTFNVPAPLSETLGAAMALLARYRGDRPLIDPMCGSGTMPIEAAMIAQNIAPGRNRAFAAERWPFLSGSPFGLARQEAADLAQNFVPDILGSDIDPHCIELCKRHAKKAGVMLEWRVRPLGELATEKQGGILLVNPPYGQRLLTKAGSDELYRSMRQVFGRLQGWSVNVITSHTDFERVYGKRADRRRKLSNGGTPCTLYQFFAPKSAKPPLQTHPNGL